MATLSAENIKHRCEICLKVFTRGSTLRDHIAAHLGQKPHQCRSCQTRFTRKIDLRNHEREVHGSSRPFVCRHVQPNGTIAGCGKGFPSMSLLVRHLKGKTAERCRHCPISTCSSPLVAAVPPDPLGGEMQFTNAVGDAGPQPSPAWIPSESIIPVVSSVPARDWMRKHRRESLIIQTPDPYKIYDWYLVTMVASVCAVEQIISTQLVTSNGSFRQVPLPDYTYYSCCRELSDEPSLRLESSLRELHLDLNQIAIQLVEHVEFPPLRPSAGILLLLDLLFHNVEAIKTHIGFIQYLHDHFLQHGSRSNDNPMHANHHWRVSLGMWSSYGDHFLPVWLANRLKARIYVGELAIQKETVQDAMDSFRLALMSFALEFFPSGDALTDLLACSAASGLKVPIANESLGLMFSLHIIPYKNASALKEETQQVTLTTTLQDGLEVDAAVLLDVLCKDQSQCGRTDCHDADGGAGEAKDDSPEDIVCHVRTEIDVDEIEGGGVNEGVSPGLCFVIGVVAF